MRSLILATQMLAAMFVASPAFATASQAAREPPPRFALKASLQAAPQPLGQGRFELHGRLEGRAGSGAAEAVGFSLKSSLEPKTGAQCLGPGSVFYDGFESAP